MSELCRYFQSHYIADYVSCETYAVLCLTDFSLTDIDKRQLKNNLVSQDCAGLIPIVLHIRPVNTRVLGERV